MSPSRVGRIRRRRTFGALRRPAGRSARGPIRVSYVRSDGQEGPGWAEVGYGVDRRCGGAVERNRLRRRLRAAARHAHANLDPGAYLLRSGPGAADLDPRQLDVAVRDAMVEAASAARDASTGRPRRGGSR